MDKLAKVVLAHKLMDLFPEALDVKLRVTAELRLSHSKEGLVNIPAETMEMLRKIFGSTFTLETEVTPVAPSLFSRRVVVGNLKPSLHRGGTIPGRTASVMASYSSNGSTPAY